MSTNKKLCLILIFLLGVDWYLNSHPDFLTFTSKEQEEVSIEETETKEEKKIDFDAIYNENAFVFEDSDKRYITEEDIEALKAVEKYGQSYESIIRIAINEIYARKGYDFRGTQYEKRFCSEKWYQALEKKKIKESDFNEFEQKNIDLLASEVKE